jgi:tetratricopeptide (TPR) repeat protein
MCIDESRFEEALRYAEIGLKTQPSYPELIFNRALCLLEIKKHTEGIKEFKRYLKYVRTNPWAYNNIGDAYRSLGRPDKAERYLKKAIKLDDSFAPGYGNLALLRSDQRRYAECIELGKIAQQLGPLNKEVQLVMGEAYMSLGEHRRGLQYLVDATLLDRNFIEAYESMSAAYVELEMYELAIAAAQEALKLNPKSWMALANLGYSYAKRFKYADAIIFQNKALQCNPTPEGRYKTAWDLGWNYLQVDNYARALRWTEEAIRLKENPDVVLFFNRALILFAKGQIRRATSAYREARAMAKTLGDEQVILEAIKDIRYFVSRKGIQEQEASTLLALLDADFGPTN